MTQRFKKLIWKRAGAGITTLGLCGAMLFTQAAVPNYVWAEGNTEQIAAQQPADPVIVIRYIQTVLPAGGHDMMP